MYFHLALVILHNMSLEEIPPTNMGTLQELQYADAFFYIINRYFIALDLTLSPARMVRRYPLFVN